MRDWLGMQRLVRVLLVVSVLLGAACGGSDDGGDDAVSGDGADVLAAIRRFDAASGDRFESRARLDRAVLADPAASRTAALEHLSSDDHDVRLAAVFVLSQTLRPEDADALAALLESADPAERVLAAAAMLSVGDGRAVEVLIAMLGVRDEVPFGRPHREVWRYARYALLSFTGQDFGLRAAATADDAAATAVDWRAWWGDAAPTFEVVRAPSRFSS